MTTVMPVAGDNGSNTPIPSTKRVSYILPGDDHTPRMLRLPSLANNTSLARGRSGPLLLPRSADAQSTPTTSRIRSMDKNTTSTHVAHPQHRLPISSLAIDTSTLVDGYADHKPTGILYTGGRDGMIGAWELGLSMRRRKVEIGLYENEEDEEDDEGAGAVTGLLDEMSLHRRRKSRVDVKEWEIDVESENASSLPPSKFRQCLGSHTDWINDIALCNHNQTVISASSDRTVRIWNPHDPTSSLIPQSLGTHKDYVRSLALATRANWIASGSFDQTIKVWDLKELRAVPIMTVSAPSLRSSVYDLAVNEWGTVLAAATPEKTIQLWDPRSGQQVSQLIGHTDNVRSVVLSRDGSHLLSASSDSTIRLWSVAEQRCIHTFTHHSDSVWSLFSDHDSLDIFYSGDRNGVVCKVDWERCNEVSEGECVVLAKEKARGGNTRFHQGSQHDTEAASILKIVAADHAYFWTASANGSVCRWKDVPPRSKREVLYPIGTHHPPQSGEGRAVRNVAATSTSFLSSPLAASSSSRPGALRDSSGGNMSNNSLGQVSFEQANLSTHHGSNDLKVRNHTPFSEGKGALAATLYGLPFHSLVCMAPPDDLYGAAIGLGSLSVRTVERRDSQPNVDSAMFSSASLISIPSVLRATASGNHLQHHPNRDSIGGASQVQQRTDDYSSPVLAPLNAHLASALQQHREGARPSSTRSAASIRFAPTTTYKGYDGEGPIGSYDGGEEAGRLNAIPVDEDDDEALEARQSFEDRDSAMDAKPLRPTPDDVIHCSHGLIRSSMLNDRRHVLTIDSAGQISVWDIVTAKCLGAYDWDEVSKECSLLQASDQDALHLRPGDALDFVKERIQGEAATPMWCTVDTKIGSLSVHFDYPRCFDAEIYLDEVHASLEASQATPPSFTHKEDQRTNMARLVLRNLFDGFISREAQLRGGGDSARLKSDFLAVERPAEIAAADNKVKMRLDLKNTRAALGRTESGCTPGMTIALAVPPKTPAILPMSSPLTPAKNGMELPGLQQILASDRKTFSSQQADANGNGSDDYFSLQRSGNGGDNKVQTPLAKPSADGTAAASTISSPVSPGGSGLMGRLRLSIKRGDQKGKEDKGPPTPRTVNVSAIIEAQEIDSQDNSVVKQHLDHARRIVAKAEPGRLLEEVARVPFPPRTAIVISESKPESDSACQVDYRGLVQSTENDLSTLEVTSPPWLLECLLGASEHAPLLRDSDKLTFLLMPWESPTAPLAGSSAARLEKMPLMPTGNSRLTATKMLRMKKVCTYIADKLNILDEGNIEARSRVHSIVASRRGSATPVITDGTPLTSTTHDAALSSPPPPPSSSSSYLRNPFLSMSSMGLPAQTSSPSLSPSLLPLANGSNSSRRGHEPTASSGAEDETKLEPHEMIDVLCNGVLLPPMCTLAQVQRFYWKSSNALRLEYRWHEPQ